MGSKSFPEIISEIKTSVASLAKEYSSGAESYAFAEFSLLVEKLSPILGEFKHNNLMIDTPPIQKAIKSLETELKRALALIKTTRRRRTSPPNNCRSPAPQPPTAAAKQIEEMTHDLGRSLGLVLFAASHDMSTDVKHKIEALRKDMMNARFYSSSDAESELFHNDVETDEDETEYEDEDEDEEEEEEIIQVVDDNKITLDVDDIVLQLKYGNDDEFRCALSGLMVVIRDNMVTNEWINDEGVIPILFNRLGSNKPSNRLTIIQMIRSLASHNPENMEKMADVGSLSTLVKSLMRDAEEQREAVGLLSSLSDLPAVRRRIGRIQGCIVMSVSIFNGDDPVASHDAVKLLNSLSGNTQNALHMAEAGYFKPLVHYLMEGSDMSKILMATALSRMELTDQSKASLGEDGAIEPLVKMFNSGKLEAKLSALSALQNLSSLKENIQRLISSGIVVNLLQLLFSVTSVLMTLREPASAILARIAQSESILVNQDVAQQMLSLLNLSSPVIQCHLLQALNSIAAHSGASSKVRRKLKENGAVQLLLPFLTETNAKIRASALNLIYTLSKDLLGELMEQLGETHLSIIVNIISSSVSETEKAAAVGILSNLPASDKKATDILKRAGLLTILISLMTSSAANSTPVSSLLAESIAGVLIRFTVPIDKKLQKFSAEQGVIPLLVKLLSIGSPVAKCRAATSLAQLSQNSVSLRKSRKSRWMCVPPSVDAFCEVHDGYCFVKSTFCLVKAGAVSSLVQILGGNEREADEAVLCALASLLEDEICENGSNCIAKMSGVQAIINVLESGSLKAQEKALWILDRIFRVEAYRVEYGESALVVLIDLAQNGDPQLKPTIAKLLAQLDVLQFQSSYF